MVQLFIQAGIFFIASLTAVWLISLSTSYQFYQQLISVIIILDILIASRTRAGQVIKYNLYKNSVLFLSALLVQLIVISSGGFYSPLLILVHIFTLGAIFFLSGSSPIFFLVFSIGVLVFQVSHDKNLYQFFQNDPWTTVIYVISIIIVIPLALFIARNNSMKDKFNNFLKNYISESEQKQKTILTALSNIVIVTDSKLNIVSVNIAVERLMRTSLPQITGKPISDLIILKDNLGNLVPFENLPVKEALMDRATHYAEGYFLETKIQTAPKPVTLQIKPLTDGTGNVTQIVFVLTDPLSKIGFNTHPTVKFALAKRDKLIADIENPPTPKNAIDTNTAILLVTHIEEDILTVQEMEDHPIQEVIGFVDVVSLIQSIVNNKMLFYKTIGRVPEVSFEDEDKLEETFLINSRDSSSATLSNSKYSAPIDSFLVKTILEKLIDLSVFISGVVNIVNIYLSLDLDKNIKIDITYPSRNLEESNLASFYNIDYPGLEFTQLTRSSGLEGYIAGRLSKTIGLSLNTSINPYKKIVIIEIIIPKQAKISETG